MTRYFIFFSLILFITCSVVWGSASVLHAASASSAPSTGLETGQRYSYGPGAENQQDKKVRGGSMKDAYGNPILPYEEEEAPRQRLRSGAYGAAPERPSRPLPDLPGTDTGWSFQ